MPDDTKDSSKKEQPQLDDELLDDVAGGAGDVTLKRGVINYSSLGDEKIDASTVLETDRSE